VGGIEQDEAVHLAGKSDALDLAARDSGGGKHTFDSGHGGVPPVLRVLLGPEGAEHEHVLVRDAVRSYDRAGTVHQKSPAATGSDIDSHPHVVRVSDLSGEIDSMYPLRAGQKPGGNAKALPHEGFEI
jgi:hypothetical protein